MSACGPDRLFFDVRFGVTLGGQAEVARTNGKENLRPPKHRTRCRRRPEGRRFRFRSANSTFPTTRQLNVTSPTTSSHLAWISHPEPRVSAWRTVTGGSTIPEIGKADCWELSRGRSRSIVIL